MATDPTVAIIVGRRRDYGWRDRLWERCRARWEPIGWPIIEGHHDGPGPFCMSIAANRAAAETDADVFVHVGGDHLILDPGHAIQAAETAHRKGVLTFAHDRKIALDEAATHRFLDSGILWLDDGEEAPNTFAGVTAIPRPLFEKVGGFDERFIGWGGEDLAIWSACWAIAGAFERMPGTIVHLWHPRSHDENEGHEHYPENDALMRRYIDARRSPREMRKILAERGIE